MNEIHFFDLDFTIWRLDLDLVIIDKNNPMNILARIPSYENSFLKSFYKKYNIPIKYNGGVWWLSPSIRKEVKDYDLKDLGISKRLYKDEDFLKKQINKIEWLTYNLNHLENKTNFDVGVLTARANLMEHKEILEKLQSFFKKEFDKKISKIYFVNDKDGKQNDNLSAVRKSNKILSTIIGYKIDENKKKFIKEEHPQYNIVHFYDDLDINIDVANKLNKLLKFYLHNTEKELKETIEMNIKYYNYILYTYKITQNQLNPFIKETVYLHVI